MSNADSPKVAELAYRIADFAREEGVTMEMLDTAIELVKEAYYTDALIKGCPGDDTVDRLVKDIRKQAITKHTGIAI